MVQHCRYQITAADSLRYSGDSAEGTDDLRGACRQALRFAQRYNAWLGEAAALLALVQAWQQLVAVAVTKRYATVTTLVHVCFVLSVVAHGLRILQHC